LSAEQTELASGCVNFIQKTSELLTAHGVKVKAWDKSWAESKKMGSFLSVARGSSEPPVFLELGYSGAPDQEKPVVLVGKFYICGWYRFCSYQSDFLQYPEK
jgi:leucyl aminopeptidase